MEKKLSLFSIIIIQIFILKTTQNSISLEINKSKSHKDQTGKLTPLVVTLSCPDIDKKTKGVDIIFVVDISGSMSDKKKLDLVKESLKYLVSIMEERDRIALVIFSDKSKIIGNLTEMTQDNKTEIINYIDNLKADGGTNIYSGLEDGLSLLKENYTDSDNVASIVLLSDGWDNYWYKEVVNKFKQLLIQENKKEYAFTLHTFGYGQDHDAILMDDLSKVKDGGYFAIENIEDVTDVYIKLFGSLSTVCSINIQLVIQSSFVIDKIYGMEDMYEASLNKTVDHLYIFNVKLIQVVHGKKYDFVSLIDIPENMTYGTEILNTTIYPLGINANYLWDDKNNTYAYEEYIRCICVTYFSYGYEIWINKSASQAEVKVKEGLSWIQNNYINGMRNWEGEFNGVLNDIKNTNNFGKANLLSKIRELKTSKIGIHYSDENSYQRKILDQSHNIDVRTLPILKIDAEKNIIITNNINYYYFYLKEGNGEINNISFYGNLSSFIIYSDNDNDIINIKTKSDYMELYYWNETKDRMQTVSDFSHPGKFIFKKIFLLNFIHM